MARNRTGRSTGAAAPQPRAFERTSPSQLRARLRQERERLSEVQDHLATLLDRMDDMEDELESRDDSGLKKWYIFAAVLAFIGLPLMLIPGLLLTVLGAGALFGALACGIRYFSERAHIDGYYNRLVTRLSEYRAQEKRYINQIEICEQNISKIESLLAK